MLRDGRWIAALAAHARASGVPHSRLLNRSLKRRISQSTRSLSSLWLPWGPSSMLPPSSSSSTGSSNDPPSSSSSTTEKSTDQDDQERIISALVVNRPGTLAQLADVFGYAEQNISGLCVRPTVVPELSRVTITCQLAERELAAVQKRLKALVAVTFFHITTMRSCVENNELLLRSHALLQVHHVDEQDLEKQAKLTQLLTEYGAEIIMGEDRDDVVIPDARGNEWENNQSGKRVHFIHMADDPARIDEFVEALKREQLVILELQLCGPLFLDASQSTLDKDTEMSFTPYVAAEIERMLTEQEEEEEGEQGQEQEHEATQAANPTEKRGDLSTTRQILVNNLQPASAGSDSYNIAQSVKYKIDGLDMDDDDGEADDRRREPQKRPLATTYELHTNAQGHFTTDRLKLHARIAYQLYEATTPQNVALPKFVLLIGIPGSGKSTILSHLDSTAQLTLSDFVNFDVDDIIALLPEFYHAMLNIGLGNADKTATTGKRAAPPGPQLRYQMCRDEARFILRKNLHSAIMCRRNIILHGTGKSFTRYAQLIDQVKSAGFDTHVVCLDIPLPLAYERVHRRSSGHGRDVPRVLIDFTASLITRNFRRLAGRVPNAHLFSNDVMPPRLVWSKQRAKIVESDAQDPVQQKYEL